MFVCKVVSTFVMLQVFSKFFFINLICEIVIIRKYLRRISFSMYLFFMYYIERFNLGGVYFFFLRIYVEIIYFFINLI